MMSVKTIQAILSSLLLITLAFLATTAPAQPPALMHYQGRLSTSAGVPITTPQTVYFSLWSGGTATTANSGTAIYRESAQITPSSNGVFDHTVGSGTPDSGNTLKPSDFITVNPIYLQVDVNGATLLPRARMTSVGYSFYAASAETASFATQAGLPRVTSVVDKTGGVVVVGDLLQINGQGLSKAQVLIGGRPAPLAATPTDTTLLCQVPAGVPMGYNPVSIIDAGNGLASVTAAHVNVHRMLVWVAPGNNPQIIVLDALTRQKVVELTLPYSLGIDLTIERLQMAFANEGSLAIIPSNNTDGWVYCIDLTANPPTLVSGNGIPLNAIRVTAVAVSPDNLVMVASDISRNQLRVMRINQHCPPYTNALFTYDSYIPLPFDFNAPRGSAFVGNGMFIVCSSLTNKLFAFRRDPLSTYFYFYDPIDGSNLNIVNELSVGTMPFAIHPTRDLTRFYLVSRNQYNIWEIPVAPEGFGPPTADQSVGSGVWGVAVSPDARNLFVADNNADLIHQIGGDHVIEVTRSNGTITDINQVLPIIGDMENNFSNLYKFQLAAMEPVTGSQLAVGTDYNRLHFFERDGGTIMPIAEVIINGTNRVTYELQYQP